MADMIAELTRRRYRELAIRLRQGHLVHAVGRPDRISAEGPAVVHAVYWAGVARSGAGRQDDLALSRAVGAGRHGGKVV